MPVVEPSADGSRLEPDWRTRIAADVLALGDAWTDPAAWTGITRAGPFDMPGEVGGLVALDELVVHGWDLAAATGQPFTADDASVEGVGRFAAMFSGDEEERGSGFGRPIDVAPTAPALDQVLGLLGRDPTWTRPG